MRLRALPMFALACVLCAACSNGSDEPGQGLPSGAPATPTGESSTGGPDGTRDEPTSPSATPTPTPTPTPDPTLPGGGRTIFPDYRLVGFAGGRAPSFGRLDASNLDGAADDLDEVVRDYEKVQDRPVLPVFELIAVVAHGSPTASGLYRTVEPDEVIEQYLDAARDYGAVLLLNVQPGRSDFLDDVKLLEKWLLEPDVGLALDPEWAVDDGQVPGQTYGSTTGAELDSVAAYLSDIAIEHNLPEKALVFHQVHPSVVTDEDELGEHAGVELIKSVDGIGARGSKEATWDRLMPTKPRHVSSGFKLFFEEDARHGSLMTPKQVLALRPTPEYVLYE